MKKIYKWVERKHGSDELCHVTVTRGKKHDYLDMILDCTKNHHVGVDMMCYQEDVCE